MSDVPNPSCRGQHVMLLYDTNSNRDLATINCINLALENKQLCIYASVNVVDTSYLSKISSGIKDYEEHINKRNLFIVNLNSIWLRSMGFKNISITDSGKKCLDELLKITNTSKNKTHG